MTFQRGDYIQYHEKAVGKLDQIFVHEMGTHHRRVFAVITKITNHGKKNNVLDFSMLQLSQEQETVGLPSIISKKMYMLLVHEE